MKKAKKENGTYGIHRTDSSIVSPVGHCLALAKSFTRRSNIGRRFLCVILSAALALCSMPVSYIVDELNLILPAAASATSESEETAEPRVYDEAITQEVKNIIAANGSYPVSDESDLIKLSQADPAVYYDQTVNFATKVVINLTDSEFQGLGDDDYPFEGKLTVTDASAISPMLSVPLFYALSDKASFGGEITLRLEKNLNSVIFARKIVHSEDRAAENKWDIAVINKADANGDETVCAFRGLIGTIDEGAKVDLSVIMNDDLAASDSVSFEGDRGFICNEIKSGAELSVSVSGADGKKNLSVNTDSGNAGGLIGSAENAAVNFGTLELGKITVGASENAGGIIGKCKNTQLNFSKPEDGNTAVNAAVSAGKSSYGGGIAGYYEYGASQNSDFSNISSVSAEISGGESAGGLFGKVCGNGAMSVCGTQSERIDVSLTVKSAVSGALGGLVGAVDSKNGNYVYLKTENVNITLTKVNGTSGNFGGLVGILSDMGHFLDVGSVSVKVTDDSNVFKGTLSGGGLVGSFESGVLRLGGITDLSAAKPAPDDNNPNNAQLVGKRNKTLIYALGSGSDSGWTLNRCDEVTADDIGSWGEVLRNTSALEYDGEAHTVTVGSAWNDVNNSAISIANADDFAKIALNIQLNDGDIGALKFQADSKSAVLLAADLSIEGETDLSGSGITGFTRDDGSQIFKGTLNGNGNTLKLAIGECYGKRGGNLCESNAVNGSGQIYRHSNNGLFGGTENGVKAENITIDGVINVCAKKDDISVGGISAVHKSGALTVNGVDVKEKITVGGEKSVYVGGIIGKIESGTADIKSLTANCEIAYGGSSNYSAYLSEIIAYAANAQITVNFSDVEVGGSIENTNAIFRANVGGLIAEMASNSDLTQNKTVNIDNVTVKDLQISTCTTNEIVTGNFKSYAQSGGLLGHNWYNATVKFKSKSDENARGLIIENCSLTASCNSGSKVQFGGLVCGATGYWQVNDIQFKNTKISGSSAVAFGMLACSGDSRSNSALYLELTGNAAIDSYKIGSDVDISLSDNAVFDELVAYTGVDSDGSAGVISIPAYSGGNAEVIMDGEHCNTYQAQTNVSNSANNKDSSNSRYYYNLDTIRSKTSDLSDGEKLLLWSVNKYSADNLRGYFKGSGIDQTIPAGEYNMQGLSYYPIDVTENFTVASGVSIEFCNDKIEQSEKIEGDGIERLTSLKTQHYRMHFGLFKNIKEGKTLTVNGITLSGSVGLSSEGSGALVCGSIAGTYSSSNISNPATAIVNKVVLKNLTVYGFNGDNSAPLLINKIATDATCNFTDISAAYSDNVKAASSLIGKVGSSTAGRINISFLKIKLESERQSSIFSRATLLESFQYADNASSGTYNFDHDEDWGENSYPHNVTYGYEITYSKDNETLQEKYRDRTYYVHPIDSAATAAYDFTYEDYLPYVWYSNATAEYVTSSLTNCHELDVNLVHYYIEEGCGTYGDPYIITDGTQLEEIAKNISNGSFDKGYEINYPNSTDGECLGESSHKRYTSEASGVSLKSEDGTVLDPADLQKYLCDAYYKIDGNIELGSSFIGLGGSNQGVNQFRGVIVGKNENITVTNKSTAPLINNSYGSVVKNLKIVYTQNKVTLTQNANKKFGLLLDSNNYCSYYGGVIGHIVGGDNIIDNVKVTFESDYTITLSGKDEYDKLIAVGGYVGVISGGGLIFRNMTDGFKLTEETLGKVSSEDYLYVNPYVGRVLDGYAVNIGEYTADQAEEKHTLNNGSKNYPITDIDDPSEIEEADKISCSLPFDTDNAASGYVFEWNGSNDIFTMVNLPDSQSLFIMSLITNSGAGAMRYGTPTGMSYLKSGTSLFYEQYTPYAIGKTHLADYSNVGNIKDTKDEDFKLSQKDCAGSNNYTDNKTDEVPYLVYYYSAKASDTVKTNKQDSTKKGKEAVIPYPVRTLAGGSARFSFTLTGSGTYKLPEGFMGICGMYRSHYGADTIDVVKNRLIWMFGFNGNGNTVDMNISVKNYGSKDNYNPVGVGFFNQILQNDNTNMKDGTVGAWLSGVLRDGSDSDKLGHNIRETYAIRDITFSGKVEFSCLKLNNSSNPDVPVGGVIGQQYNRSQSLYFDSVTLKDLVVSGPKDSGGLVGKATNNLNDFVAVNISAENLTVKGSQYSGGILGQVTNCTNTVKITGGSEVYNTDYSALKNVTVTASTSAGGLIGYVKKPTVISGMSVEGGTVEGNSRSGGLIGMVDSVATVISDSAAKNLTIGKAGVSNDVGALVGTVQGNNSPSVKGYNLLSYCNTLKTSGNNKGNWIGNSNSKPIQLVGISKQGDDSQLVQKDIGSGANSSNYLIYADYNYSEADTKTDSLSGNDAYPYVTVNPKQELLKIGDKYVTSDGAADSGELISDSAKSNGNKAYKNVSDVAADFAGGGKYADKLTTYGEADSTAKTNYPALADLPILVIDDNSSSAITSCITEYISVLTNDTSAGYSIGISSYQYTDSGFVQAQASLKYSDGKFSVSTGMYDNEKGRITLIDVKYSNPANTSSSEAVYHLYIPVMVKRLLSFSFSADVLTGTDYYAPDYADSNDVVVESHGTSVTSYITFAYSRSAEEWNDAINSGDNLMWNFEKSVNLCDDKNSDITLPQGTKLTLVDRNNGGKAYFKDGTSGNLLFKSFTDFVPVTLSELLLSSDKISVLAEKITSDNTSSESSTKFVETEKAEATVMAELEDGSVICLKPYEESVGEESGEAVETPDLYTVTAKSADLGIKDSERFSIEENYYLTVETPGDCSDIVKFVVSFTPAQLAVPEGQALPTQKESLSTKSVVFGNFFKQTLKVSTYGSSEAVTDNKIKAGFSATIEFNGDYERGIYNDYSSSIKGLFQSFIISLKEFDEIGNSSDINIMGCTADVTYTVKPEDGEAYTESFQERLEEQEWYQTECPVSIKEYLKNNNKITVEAVLTLSYSDETLQKQFPTRASGDEYSGVAVQAKSNISFSRSSLVNSAITSGIVQDNDGSGKHFYIENPASAKFSYNVQDYNSGDASGLFSQLGINANELEANPVPITAKGIYDASALADVSSAKKIRFELTLLQKGDDGAYTQVNIDDYLQIAQFEPTDSSYSFEKKSNGQQAVGYYYTADWSPENGEKTFDITTKYLVNTENNNFEDNGYFYANYQLMIKAVLLDGSGNVIENTDCRDYVIYTNAKIYTGLVP